MAMSKSGDLKSCPLPCSVLQAPGRSYGKKCGSCHSKLALGKKGWGVIVSKVQLPPTGHRHQCVWSESSFWPGLTFIPSSQFQSTVVFNKPQRGEWVGMGMNLRIHHSSGFYTWSGYIPSSAQKQNDRKGLNKFWAYPKIQMSLLDSQVPLKKWLLVVDQTHLSILTCSLRISFSVTEPLAA